MILEDRQPPPSPPRPEPRSNTSKMGELSFYTGLGILLSAATQVVTAYYFGAGRHLDAFLVSAAFPTLIVQNFLMAINSVFIPQYLRLEEAGERRAATQTVFWGVIAGTALCAVIGWFLTPAALRLVMPDLPAETFTVAVRLSPVWWGIAVLQVVFSFCAAALQANDDFSTQGRAPLLFNLVIILGLIASASRGGIWAYAVVTLVAAIAQVALLLPRMRDLWPLERRSLQWGYAKRFLLLAWPLLVGGLIVRATPVMERAAAAGLPPGSISKLSYAFRIWAPFIAVSVNGLVVVLFPMLARLASNTADFRRQLVNATHAVLFLMLPLIAFILLFREPLTHLFLVRGAFSSADGSEVARALLLYAPYALAAAVGSIFGKGLYALQRTKTATALDVLGVLVYGGLLWIGVHRWGADGVAGAMSLYYVLFTALAGWILFRQAGGTPAAGAIRDGWKLALPLAVMLLIMWPVHRFLFPYAPLVALVIAGLAGGAGYLGFTWTLHQQTSRRLADYLRTLLR